MISSVSNVNFRGDAAPVNHQDLISSPGKYSSEAPKAGAPADSFEKKDGAEKPKSKTPAVLSTIAALLVAAYVGLSVAVHKGSLGEAKGAELKLADKVKNFFYKVGKSGDDLWGKIRGKKVDAEDASKKTYDAPDAKKADTKEAPKADGAEAKPAETKAEGAEAKPAETKEEEKK